MKLEQPAEAISWSECDPQSQIAASPTGRHELQS
jgi:hypothetical protein